MGRNMSRRVLEPVTTFRYLARGNEAGWGVADSHLFDMYSIGYYPARCNWSGRRGADSLLYDMYSIRY